ncbi:MAG TPA: AbiV family abortive infection protein [Patescibacteria group bacterium]|jgi:AbiV family abortive infection protein|nr:AbiV family abortive infection protein [Patescibacteria group bacterium]
MIVMSCFIPYASLQEGIELASENALQLKESAELLFKGKKYLLSASISILGFEEIAKAEFLLGYYKRKENVSESEWENFTRGRGVHRKKLEAYLSRERTYSRMTTSENPRLRELIARMTNYFQSIKESVFYVNWTRNEGWRWSPRDYPRFYQRQLAHAYLEGLKERCLRMRAASR